MKTFLKNAKAKISNRVLQASVATALTMASANSNADFALPTPVDTVTDGNYISMVGKAFSELATLLIGIFGTLSIIIMGALFAFEFTAVNQGKKTWGNLAITMAVGGLILVVVYILLGNAATTNTDGF